MDFWSLLLTACLEDHGADSAEEGEDSNVLAYSCRLQDPDLAISVTSQLTHLVFNSKLDTEKHVRNLDLSMKNFLKTNLGSMEAGVSEARLRTFMQFLVEFQVGLLKSCCLVCTQIKYFTYENPLFIASLYTYSGLPALALYFWINWSKNSHQVVSLNPTSASLAPG